MRGPILEITETERRFVERLVERLSLGPDDREQVEAWLAVSPAPSEVDAANVPHEHRKIFIEAARAVMYADGNVDEEEREQLERLKQALEA